MQTAVDDLLDFAAVKHRFDAGGGIVGIVAVAVFPLQIPQIGYDLGPGVGPVGRD